MREVERRVALLRAPRTQAGPDAATPTRARPRSGCARPSARGSQIARRGRGGQLRIAFATEAELNRLFELLVRPGRPRPSERPRGIVEPGPVAPRGVRG